MHKIAAVGLVGLLAGLGACGSDDNSSATTPATASLTTSAATTESASQTTVDFASDTTAESAVDSTTETTDSSAETTDSSTQGTDVDISSRMDQAREALKDGDFTAMLQALELSGLASEIEDREITILAPTDQAFADLPAGTVSDLATNPTKVDDVLKRHIIDELLTYEELGAKTSVTMLSGETLTVTNEGGVVKVDGATVTEGDSSGSSKNGQDVSVLAVDRVLLDS